MQRHARIVRRYAEGSGRTCDRFLLQFNPSQQISMGWFQGRQELFETGADLSMRLGIVGQRRRVPGPRLIPARGGVATSHMVYEHVAQDLIKPRDGFLLVVHLTRMLQRLYQPALQYILGIGLIAHARSQERSKGVPVGKQCCRDIG